MSAPIDFSALNPILLIETYVAGLFAHDRGAVLKLEAGQLLELVREPDNAFDPYAIVLKSDSGAAVGHLPRSDNAPLARLMDAGKQLYARVSEVTAHGSRIVAELQVFLRNP